MDVVSGIGSFINDLVAFVFTDAFGFLLFIIGCCAASFTLGFIFGLMKQ